VRRLSGAQTGLGQQEINGKAPIVGDLQELMLCVLIKDKHGLRIVFVKLAVSQFREGVLRIRWQVPPSHRKLIQRPAGIQNEPDTAFPERAAA
jgi:hypothetical protein